jgi:hypothetical protein
MSLSSMHAYPVNTPTHGILEALGHEEPTKQVRRETIDTVNCEETDCRMCVTKTIYIMAHG